MVRKSCGRPAEKSQKQGKGRVGASRREGFEQNFKGLVGSIGTKHELGFIVDIATFQLA